MGNGEVVSWNKALSLYNLSSEELFDLCEVGLPVYTQDQKRVCPASMINFELKRHPRVCWGRILFNNELEEIKFSPNVESNSKIKNVLFKDDIFDCNLFLFKFFKKTGDFLIVRKDCAPSLHDELLYRSIIEYSFPEKISKFFFRDIVYSSFANRKQYKPTGEMRYPFPYGIINILKNKDIPTLESKFVFRFDSPDSPSKNSIKFIFKYEILNSLSSSYSENFIELEFNSINPNTIIKSKKFFLRKKITDSLNMNDNICIYIKESQGENCKRSRVVSLSTDFGYYLKYKLKGTTVLNCLGFAKDCSSGTEETRYSRQVEFWNAFYSGHLVYKTFNAQNMNITIYGKKYRSPSILDVHKAIEFIYSENGECSSEDLFEKIYSRASLYTYLPEYFIDKGDDGDLFIFEFNFKRYEKIKNLSHDDQYKDAFLDFYFHESDLKEKVSRQRIMSLVEYKEYFLSQFKAVVERYPDSTKEREGLNIVLMKFQTGVSHERAYDSLPKNEPASSSSKKIIVNRLLKKANEAVKRDFSPHTLPADWSEFARNPLAYYQNQACLDGIVLSVNTA